MVTETQQTSRWERALVRAQANGVKVRLVGRTRDGYAETLRYEATSTSRPGTLHRVAIHTSAAGVEVVCGCEAGQRGQVCQHAAGALKHAGLFVGSEPATVPTVDSLTLLGAQADTRPVEEPAAAPAPRALHANGRSPLAVLTDDDDPFVAAD